MDAFALARLQARRRRAHLPAGIMSGYAAVEWDFTAAGIEILKQKIDGTVLGGCDAKLFREASAVYVRDDVPQPEQALHLAHELGHLDLHKPHEKCELHKTDLRPAGSRAISRVEAYGPRERRELMANVFGREYLLPRDLARQLFVEDRLSAPAIAARLGLPLGMVRLQLFDALLQADVAPPKEKGAKKPQKLDPSQARAVDFKGRALLVEAGPGSGKTKTLVARINRLLETEHPSRILALTFLEQGRRRAVLPRHGGQGGRGGRGLDRHLPRVRPGGDETALRVFRARAQDPSALAVPSRRDA